MRAEYVGENKTLFLSLVGCAWNDRPRKVQLVCQCNVCFSGYSVSKCYWLLDIPDDTVVLPSISDFYKTHSKPVFAMTSMYRVISPCVVGCVAVCFTCLMTGNFDDKIGAKNTPITQKSLLGVAALRHWSLDRQFAKKLVVTLACCSSSKLVWS